MTWQYIAGFFDGEGSISYNGKGYRLTISQSHYTVLKQIHTFTGVGHIFKVTKRQAHWKDSWVYSISKQSDIVLFLKQIKPYLVVKKGLVVDILPKLLKQTKIHENRLLKSKFLQKSAKELRKDHLSYREIGKRLNIDFGHARRLTMK